MLFAMTVILTLLAMWQFKTQGALFKFPLMCTEKFLRTKQERSSSLKHELLNVATGQGTVFSIHQRRELRVLECMQYPNHTLE